MTDLENAEREVKFYDPPLELSEASLFDVDALSKVVPNTRHLISSGLPDGKVAIHASIDHDSLNTLNTAIETNRANFHIPDEVKLTHSHGPLNLQMTLEAIPQILADQELEKQSLPSDN